MVSRQEMCSQKKIMIVIDPQQRLQYKQQQWLEQQNHISMLRHALYGIHSIQAEESLAQSLSDASSAEEKSAQALAESEGAAQIAAWEAKSLREELETLRQRSQELSQELSSELEKARSRESSALKTAESSVIGELDGLRQAAKEAEKRSELAENGLARMKEKKKRDLQVRFGKCAHACVCVFFSFCFSLPSLFHWVVIFFYTVGFFFFLNHIVVGVCAFFLWELFG